MNGRREVVDGDGVWSVVTHPSGVVSRTLVKPSPEYLAAREAEADAERAAARARAQAVVDQIEDLESRQTIAQLRAYLVGEEKRRLGYDNARAVLDERDDDNSGGEVER